MELKLIRKETAEGGVYGTIHLDGERRTTSERWRTPKHSFPKDATRLG